MSEVHPEAIESFVSPEFPNMIGMLAEHLGDTPFGHFLHMWESVIYCVLIGALLVIGSFFATRKRAIIPGRLQNLAEMYVTGVDDFVCEVLGLRGRQYTPFIGTVFIYVLFMNYIGMIPFFRSPTTEWSTTFGLAIIVFVYVQYTAFKELGLLGYGDHLMGKPRGIMAMTLIMPIFMLALHLIGELIRPFSLSLRLRSNIWGDDMLLALMASWGVKGLPVLFVNYVIVFLASTIQAIVFSMLTLVYFALVLVHEDEHHEESKIIN